MRGLNAEGGILRLCLSPCVFLPASPVKAHGAIMVPHSKLIEGTVAELRNGTVLMVFRTQASHFP